MGIVTQVSPLIAIGSHFSRATAANDDVEDTNAPDFTRLMGVTETLALAEIVAPAPIEKTACAVFVAVADAVAEPSTTVTAADVADADALAVADASRTRIPVDVIDAEPAAIVSSGP